jgi:hypothetical protein
MPEEKTFDEMAAANQMGGKVVSDDEFGFEEAQNGFWKHKVGDSIKGTYISKDSVPAKGIYQAQIQYTLLTDNGMIICAFGVSKKFIHQSMARARYGQFVKFERLEDYETDAYKKNPETVKPAQTFKVYLGKMDPNYNPEELEEAI